MEGLGKLLETVWELGMRPLAMDALYRFADVPWDLPFSDLAREVEGRMVEKVLDGYRPEFSLGAWARGAVGRMRRARFRVSG